MLSKTKKHTTTFGNVAITFSLPETATLREEGLLIGRAIDHASAELNIARRAGYTPVAITANELGAWVSCSDDAFSTGGVA